MVTVGGRPGSNIAGPDERDNASPSSDIALMNQYVKKHCPGLCPDGPDIVESCILSVRVRQCMTHCSFNHETDLVCLIAASTYVHVFAQRVVNRRIDCYKSVLIQPV